MSLRPFTLGAVAVSGMEARGQCGFACCLHLSRSCVVDKTDKTSYDCSPALTESEESVSMLECLHQHRSVRRFSSRHQSTPRQPPLLLARVSKIFKKSAVVYQTRHSGFAELQSCVLKQIRLPCSQNPRLS